MEAEDELSSVKSEIAELKKKHEQEADEWVARNKRLLEDRNRLSEDYSRVRLCFSAYLNFDCIIGKWCICIELR